MLTQLNDLLRAMRSSVRELVPIVAVIAFFRIVVLRPCFLAHGYESIIPGKAIIPRGAVPDGHFP